MGFVLNGINVVAFETGVAAPICSAMLADFGARVVKIERPGVGDVSREWDTVAKGFSSAFVWLNRNKKSLTLNTKLKEGKEILRNLVKGADVFLHNFAPETAEKLGITYADLKGLNSRLVYCGISGYGKDGPYRNEKSYDLVMQGETGLISLTGSPEFPAKIPLSICDICAGVHSALGIILSLFHRERTGEGQEVEVTMFEAMLSWLGYFPYYFWYRGQKPAREGMRHQILTPYGPYKGKNGKYVNFAVLSNEDWKNFCYNVIERKDLLEDLRFESNEKRIQNRRDLENILEETFEKQERDYWLEKFRSAGLPCGRVNEIDEVLNHPQTIFRKVINEVNSSAGKLKAIQNPIRMSKSPSRLESVPDLGEHTEEILTELGYSKENLTDLRAKSVI